MVDSAERYSWTSHRAKIGLIECDWIDQDPCFIALGHDLAQRQIRYKQFVEQGISRHELEFISTAVQRNRLTGNEAFALEIEQRIGERILFRAQRRPCSRP
jgi:putative transposase